MARRRLLTGDERRRLFDPPVQETAIIGHYTLSAEDVELVGAAMVQQIASVWLHKSL